MMQNQAGGFSTPKRNRTANCKTRLQMEVDWREEDSRDQEVVFV